MEDKLLEMVEASVRGENDPSRSELSAETLARLESLGYVGGGIEQDLSFDATKEDPKDLIDTHVRMAQVNSMVSQKQFQQARQACLQLISERPSHYQPYFYLGSISSKQKEHRETVRYLRKVVELKPDHIQAYRGLAEAYEALSEVDEAVEQYIKMLEIRPGYVEGYLRFAILMIEQGEFDVPHKYRTQQLFESPAYIKAAITLTEELVERRQILRACQHFRHILELAPDSVAALNGLAWIQAASATEEIRNPAEALRLALEACKLTNNENPEALDTLAAAYAAGGNFDKAIEISQNAISLAKASDKLPLAGRIAKRLALYQQKRPYRDLSIRE